MQGVGIIRLGELLVSDAIRRGGLVPIQWTGMIPSHGQFMPFASGGKKSPRLRVFLDFLIERFGTAPWRIG